MLRGIHSLSLDAKGRLALPTRYRERLVEACGGRMVLTINPDDQCLWLYPLAEWESIERTLGSLPSFDRQALRLKRLLMSHASDCAMDASGRVLLPPVLRKRAVLEKELVLLGMGNKFEIWDEQHWNNSVDQLLTEEYQEQDLSDAVRSLSL